MISLKKTILIVTALVIVLSLVSACGNGGGKKYAEYVTNEKGEYVTNEKGEKETTYLSEEDVSIEYITNEDGKKTIDEKGEYVTVVHVLRDEVVTDKDGNKVTVRKDTAKTTMGMDEKETGVIGGDSGNTVVTQTTVKQGSVTSTKDRIFDKKYKPIFASGRFTIKTTFAGSVDGQDVSLPLIFAFDGSDKVFIETKYSATRMQFIFKNNKMYMVFPGLKSYCESDLTAEGEDMSGALKEIAGTISNVDAKYVRTTNAKVDGVDCICEEYALDGTSYKYYFTKSGEKLVRIEVIDNASKESQIIIVNDLSADVSDSYFVINSSYKKIDPEKLGSLFGIG